MIIKYANLPKLQDFIELLSQHNCFDEKIHHRFLKLQQLWFWIGIGQNQKWMCWQMVLLFHCVSAWEEEEVCNVINKSSNNHGGIGAKVSELSEKGGTVTLE